MREWVMGFIVASSKAELLQILRQRVKELVDPAESDGIGVLAGEFFGITPLEELQGRQQSELLGCLRSAWRLLQEFDRTGSKLQIFNPTIETHGWQCAHTVVQLVHADMPFLVDSVRIELQRQGFAIQRLHNSVFTVERDEHGRLLELHPADNTDRGLASESVMHIEIDRCTTPAALSALQSGLRDALGQVEAVVTDHGPMRARVEALIADLDGAAFDWFDAGEREEVGDFLQWLLDDNFIFLGYERFTIADDRRLDIQTRHSLGNAPLLPADEFTSALPASLLEYLRQPLLLSFAKAPQASRVHRAAYPDYLSIREVDAEGRVLLEHRFSGFYTTRVYAADVLSIPCLRRKVQRVRERSGLLPGSHLYKELSQVLQELPRDDLFQVSEQELADTALRIVQIQERNLVRLFVRRGSYGCFYYCLVYVPRDIYSTATRMKIQQVLMDRLGATASEFWTLFSDSNLVRVQFILNVDPRQTLEISALKLQDEIIQASRGWTDDLGEQLQETLGEARAREVLSQFGRGLPPGYSNRFTPETAVVDLQHLLELDADNPLAMSFY